MFFLAHFVCTVGQYGWLAVVGGGGGQQRGLLNGGMARADLGPNMVFYNLIQLRALINRGRGAARTGMGH